jgi:hypothetical protein
VDRRRGGISFALTTWVNNNATVRWRHQGTLEAS